MINPRTTPNSPSSTDQMRPTGGTGLHVLPRASKGLWLWAYVSGTVTLARPELRGDCAVGLELRGLCPENTPITFLIPIPICSADLSSQRLSPSSNPHH